MLLILITLGISGAFVTAVGLKGYVQFSFSRFWIFTGSGISTAILVLAIWLMTCDYSLAVLALCLIADGISWEFYKYAEDAAFRVLIMEIVDRQKPR